MYVIFSFLLLALMIGALVDIIRSDEGRIKHLPKIVWVLLVVFLPLIGSVLWFVIGREYDRRPAENVSFGDPRRWHREPPAAPAAGPPKDTRSTEEQLAELEREIEYYERLRRPDQTP
ncbi:PLD nuclease N-terminal domain-containing protein [Cnuibacter sp. UC19_7]|uniref:PLD nuclease N-terminal domain-containing protein n=1 Tax=Cnuibacter sp. UC19_7 TaxID=3350166 RepID=UPI00366A5ACD